jgi:hypothetical protein
VFHARAVARKKDGPIHGRSPHPRGLPQRDSVPRRRRRREAIEFYKKAFNATELMRMPEPNGKIAHAQMDIAVVQTPDGHGRVELMKFRTPAADHPEPNNAPPKGGGQRHHRCLRR